MATKTENHTVKTRALPLGWERFSVSEIGHPGENWLSVSEFAKATNLSRKRAQTILAEDKSMETCMRLIAGHSMRFYRPKCK